MVEPKQASQETESLVKRLAGPSTGKAGLAKDQTEINRVIADASKGSKFYDNEKRKDKDLTERIQGMLKQRDEVMKGADIKRIEILVDQMLSELEAQRDLSQIIVHVDMDAFFANVELLFNPDLKGKPFGVGRGVLTTASYEARKYGVRSGMPAFIAKKLCPNLILVSNNINRYMEMSEKVMSIFRNYDPNMAVAGCDEGYLNITSYCQERDVTPDACVEEMRRRVFEETKLTASAGIAPNKTLAKICSDKNKPNGQFRLPFDSKIITDFMRDLPMRKVPGVGRVNERLLDSIGIKTCGDIYTHRATLYLMNKQFGLGFLLGIYLGIASNLVRPHQREERKSIGAERTFASLSDSQKILEKLEDIAEELEGDMEKDGWAGRTVTLKYKLDTYQVFTRAKSIERWVTKKEELYAIGKELLMPEFPLRLRLIGLRVTKLKDLRAQTSNVVGIKRFFESVKNDFPRKRPKINEPRVHKLFGYRDQARDDNLENMPGFYEDDERDLNLSLDDGAEDDELGVTDQTAPIEGKIIASDSITALRPPGSASIPTFGSTQSSGGDAPQVSNCLASSTKKAEKLSIRTIVPPSIASVASSSSGKPSSKRSNKTTLASSNKDALDCPVCGKAIMTDNQGLNAHIDFCLSRNAIREAQAESFAKTKIKPLGKLSKR
ncbi:hypothetical protein AX17_001411 [Amanita inopinata Kibby_2008]|nr:hypothetical protein AX17_001411 [Amanita inopinata Kibby_2008]